MSDNKKIIEQNIDTAIDPGAGIGGILAANHNAVLKEVLFGAGKFVGSYFTLSGALDDIAPTGTFLWNGNDPSNVGNFVVRMSELDSDLNDIGEILTALGVGSIIKVKDETGRSFFLKYQSHVSGVDPNTNNIYDVTVQGIAGNPNYIYGPTETETGGFTFVNVGGGGGGGQVNTIQDGQGTTVDASDPVNPIINLGGVINDLVNIDIDDTGGFGYGLEITGTDLAGNSILLELLPESYSWEVVDTSTNNQVNLSANVPGAQFTVVATTDQFGDQKSYQLTFTDSDQILLEALNNTTGDKTRIILKDTELRIVTPGVDGGTAVVGQILQLQNTSGESEFVDGSGLFVDLTTNQTNINGEKTFIGPFMKIQNRLALVNDAFGASRLGDSALQSPALDTQAVNWMGASQAVLAAMFSNPSGTVMSLKSFDDAILVFDVTGEDAVDGVDDAESTIANSINFTSGERHINDQGVQIYPGAVTPVGQAQFQVLQHLGGASPLDYWFGRYDGTTYTEIYSVTGANILTFANPPKVPTGVAADDAVRLDQLPGGDTDAIHDNVAGEIALITEKVTPVAADLMIIEDSADSNNKKRVQLGNLPGGGGGVTSVNTTGLLAAITTSFNDLYVAPPANITYDKNITGKLATFSGFFSLQANPIAIGTTYGYRGTFLILGENIINPTVGVCSIKINGVTDEVEAVLQINNSGANLQVFFWVQVIGIAVSGSPFAAFRFNFTGIQA